MARAGAAALALLVLGMGATGCGAGSGVSSGAMVDVYVTAPLCAAANGELARERGRAGDLRVRAVCLQPARSGGRLDLAAIGAGARRATEDSAAVAYLEPPDPAAARFSQPILESAGIARLAASSGEAGMRRVLAAIAAGGSGSPRDTVREAVEGP